MIVVPSYSAGFFIRTLFHFLLIPLQKSAYVQLSFCAVVIILTLSI